MVRTRIAPSPTGYPHIGTMYQAWLNYAFAKKHEGQFAVRIEDTDRKRFVEDAEEKLFAALDWFGIEENESVRKNPSAVPQSGTPAPLYQRGVTPLSQRGTDNQPDGGVAGEFGPYRQSERLKIYQKYIKQLLDSGDAYYCFCSSERLDEVRKQMQKDGKPPMYDGKCRNLEMEKAEKRKKEGEPYVIRLKVPENQKIIVKDLIRGDIEFDSNNVDDQVLIKSDGFPTYHFAVVVDDHLMEISHAVRGEEWIPSSPKHVLIYQALGWQPPVWVHTATLRNPDKSKLSKRQGHTNVSWYQEQGFLPEAVINFLSQLGWTHPQEKEIFNRKEFIKLFDFKDLSAVGPVFDETKLKWMNGKYIREMSDVELAGKIVEFYKSPAMSRQDRDLVSPLQKGDLHPNPPLNKGGGLQVGGFSREQLQNLIPLIKERIEVLADVAELTKFMDPELKIDVDVVKKQTKQENSKELLSTLKSQLSNLENWSVEEIEKIVRGVKTEYPDWKPREYFMTIRVATTGYPVTPPLFESIEVLGKEIVGKRLEQVISEL